MANSNELLQGVKKPYVQPRLLTHGSVEKLTERGHDHEGHQSHNDEGHDRGGPGSHIWCR
ncbi:MAG TPA: hypothetical protein VFC78_24025 [Tepidisphaeraceae bacterium]|nr:hypothetical protein [Tepidisphaeraceae bacterium]